MIRIARPPEIDSQRGAMQPLKTLNTDEGSFTSNNFVLASKDVRLPVCSLAESL